MNATETVRQLREHLQRSETEHAAVADALWQAQHGDGAEKIYNCLLDHNLFLRTVCYLAVLKKKEELAVPMMEEYRSAMKGFEEAMKKNDVVFLADLFRYEFRRVVAAWRKFLDDF